MMGPIEDVNIPREDYDILYDPGPGGGGGGGGGGTPQTGVLPIRKPRTPPEPNPDGPDGPGEPGEPDESDKSKKKKKKKDKNGEGEDEGKDKGEDEGEDEDEGEGEDGDEGEENEEEPDLTSGTIKSGNLDDIIKNDKDFHFSDHLFSSDGTDVRTILKKISDYKLRKRKRVGTKNVLDWRGEFGDTFGELIGQINRCRLPLEKIKRRLKLYKERITENQTRVDSYFASGFGPRTKEITRKRSISAEKVNKEEMAILIFCVDTSGSIGEFELELASGWLTQIANYFSSKSVGGIPGKVYLLQYDTDVHGPLEEWSRDKKWKTTKGGGGNDVNSVYEYLNAHFLQTKKSVKGGDARVNTFVFNEKELEKKGIIERDKNNKMKAVNISQRLNITKGKQDRFKEENILKSLENMKFKYQDVLIETSEFSKAPFLLFFTDGMDEIPTKFGGLYAKNLGNIFYILTNDMYLKTVYPRNFVYVDIDAKSNLGEYEVKYRGK